MVRNRNHYLYGERHCTCAHGQNFLNWMKCEVFLVFYVLITDLLKITFSWPRSLNHVLYLLDRKPGSVIPYLVVIVCMKACHKYIRNWVVIWACSLRSSSFFSVGVEYCSSTSLKRWAWLCHIYFMRQKSSDQGVATKRPFDFFGLISRFRSAEFMVLKSYTFRLNLLH